MLHRDEVLGPRTSRASRIRNPPPLSPLHSWRRARGAEHPSVFRTAIPSTSQLDGHVVPLLSRCSIMIWQSQNVAGARGSFEDSHVRLGLTPGTSGSCSNQLDQRPIQMQAARICQFNMRPVVICQEIECDGILCKDYACCGCKL